MTCITSFWFTCEIVPKFKIISHIQVVACFYFIVSKSFGMRWHHQHYESVSFLKLLIYSIQSWQAWKHVLHLLWFEPFLVPYTLLHHVSYIWWFPFTQCLWPLRSLPPFALASSLSMNVEHDIFIYKHYRFIYFLSSAPCIFASSLYLEVIHFVLFFEVSNEVQCFQYSP